MVEQETRAGQQESEERAGHCGAGYCGPGAGTWTCGAGAGADPLISLMLTVFIFYLAMVGASVIILILSIWIS